MTLLDGFKVIPLKERFDDSYLTISEKSLKLTLDQHKFQHYMGSSILSKYSTSPKLFPVERPMAS